MPRYDSVQEKTAESGGSTYISSVSVKSERSMNRPRPQVRPHNMYIIIHTQLIPGAPTPTVSPQHRILGQKLHNPLLVITYKRESL